MGESTTCSYSGKCECRDLIWGNKLSCEERKKVIEVCCNIWGEAQKMERANMLMAVMHLETRATFSPSEDNGKGYVGLVQFHSSTAEGLGTTYDALKKMTFIQQMDYVEKYLKQNKDKMNTLVDFYLQVVKPSAVGNGNKPNYIVFDESISVPDGDGSKTSAEQRNKNITREPWVTKYGYASNPPFMKEEGEYTKRKKWVYTRQQYEERYGFHNGKTYIWEIEKAINAEHYQAGISQKYTGQCVNEPKEDKKIEVVGNRAPWMDHVISEAINYGGIKPTKSVKVQKRIEKYHSEGCNINYSYKTAWCASFASWCLKEAKYPSPSTAGSLLFTTSAALEKCDLFYGGIVVFEDCDINGKKIKKPKKNKDGTQGWEQHGGGHISFIYGKITENEYAVLGGNQGTMIKVSKYDLSGNVFFSFKKTYKLVNGSSMVILFYKRFKGCYKPKGYTIKDSDYLTNNDIYKNIDEANKKLKLNEESTKKAGENSQN